MKPGARIALIWALSGCGTPWLSFSPTIVSARTWRIHEDASGDAPTIQAGIDSASDGDVVLVSAGTFVENLDFLGKEIVVQGAGRALTTLDGSSRSATCVWFRSGETRASVFTGFRVTGGRGSDIAGGGITIEESQPTIRDNLIEENEAYYIAGPRETGTGAGIVCIGRLRGSHTSPLIEQNEIANNLAGSNGAGIGAAGWIAPIIIDNVIRGNRTVYGDGAGLWLYTYNPGVLVSRNLIVGNTAGDHGGGIYCGTFGDPTGPMDPEIAFNIIEANIAEGHGDVDFSGGGIWAFASDVWIHHNTIVKNEGWSFGGGGWGGGITLIDPGTPIVEQNIIALSVLGGGIRCDDGTTPIIRNNLTWANTGGEGNGICADWWTGNGNVLADPQFCGAEVGDWSLRVGSPALTHAAGPLGAIQPAGCSSSPAQRTTWGRIKQLYR